MIFHSNKYIIPQESNKYYLLGINLVQKIFVFYSYQVRDSIFSTLLSIKKNNQKTYINADQLFSSYILNFSQQIRLKKLLTPFEYEITKIYNKKYLNYLKQYWEQTIEVRTQASFKIIQNYSQQYVSFTLYLKLLIIERGDKILLVNVMQKYQIIFVEMFDGLILSVEMFIKIQQFRVTIYLFLNYIEPKSSIMICKSTNVRNAILNHFFAFRESNHTFTRENLYICISIVDTYLKHHFFDSDDNRAIMKVAVATIWIVSKFNDVQIMKSDKIIEIFGSFQLIKEQLIQQEAKILQALDFTIPLENAYQSLANQIYFSKNMRNDEKNLRALRMLLLITKKFEGIILDPKLGIQIFLYVTKKTASERLRGLIKKIKDETNNERKISQDCPTSQQ